MRSAIYPYENVLARGVQSGMPLELEEIPKLVKVGDPVYVAADHGTAVFIRPQH